MRPRAGGWQVRFSLVRREIVSRVPWGRACRTAPHFVTILSFVRRVVRQGPAPVLVAFAKLPQRLPVRWICREVVGLLGILLEIEQFLHVRFGIEPADELPAVGADAFALGDFVRRARCERMLVVPIGPPGRGRIVEQPQPRLALHGGRFGKARKFQHRGVRSIESTIGLEPSAVLIFGTPRIEEDGGHANGLFVHQPLADQTFLAREMAVVAEENEHGVAVGAVPLESSKQPPDRQVQRLDRGRRYRAYPSRKPPLPIDPATACRCSTWRAL